MSNTTYTEPTLLDGADLDKAREGSFYTIRGAGGDLREWVEGLSEVLEAKGCGRPQTWYRTTGAAVNEYTHAEGDNRFQADLTILMFSLEGMNPMRLAMVRIEHGDVWFDDMFDNMKSSEVI